MTTLNTTCYTLKNGQVIESTLADFDHFIETTTRPTGVGYKYYATIRGETPVLAKWATWGGPEVVVREFETEAEADAAAEATYVHDILNNSELCVHLERAAAEQELAELAAA